MFKKYKYLHTYQMFYTFILLTNNIHFARIALPGYKYSFQTKLCLQIFIMQYLFCANYLKTFYVFRIKVIFGSCNAELFCSCFVSTL